jgi:hypothetical protein
MDVIDVDRRCQLLLELSRHVILNDSSKTSNAYEYRMIPIDIIYRMIDEQTVII